MNKSKKVLWLLEDEVAKHVKCERRVTENVISLLEKDNSVPFIARYRKHLTGSMEPEKIREIKEKVDELKKVEIEALKAIKFLDNTKKEDLELETSILKMTDFSLLKDLTSSLKPEARANKLKDAFRLEGLDEAASKLLNHKYVDIKSLVKPRIKGLSTHEEVFENLSLVMADKIFREKEVVDFLVLECKEISKAFIISKKINSRKNVPDSDVDKFQEFFNFRIPLSGIKPHKYLAMRRGENLGVLKTSLELDDSVERDFMKAFEKKFIPSNNFPCPLREVLKKALKFAYEKLVHPRIIGKFRNDLRKTSELAAVSSFCANLKCLLMTPPLRNKHILGVDPGYKHGCKFAIIGPLGDVLETGVVYLSRVARQTPFAEAEKLKMVLHKHRCDIVAIGDGMGCRETEEFFSHHIKIGSFKPLQIMFSIVQENGASVYSASDLAKVELPELDVSLRGAVSIARRLQDPLNELIKIDPKNLGVGMYQHDVSESKLKSSLDGVLEDCVSLVGVDINICTEITLKHVAGIGPAIAKNIIAMRKEFGVFKNRKQLLKVPLIGEKKFQQCAGFLRINLPNDEDSEVLSIRPDPQNLKRKLKSRDDDAPKKRKTKANEYVEEVNFFDRTAVHPESYKLASELLCKAKLESSNIGQECFMNSLCKFVKSAGLSQLAEDLNTCTDVLGQIIESLTKRLDEDIRSNYTQPLFRSSITEMKDIFVLQELTGRVTNVTDFGAFVDIGVEKSGLIHNSSMDPSTNLELGMRVSVRVLNIDLSRQRIGLQFLRIL